MKTQAAGPLLLAAITLALGLPLAQGAAQQAAERRFFIGPLGAAAAGTPSSDVVRTGNTFYLAGHLGIDPLTGVVPADNAVEARLLMDAVQRTVRSAGLQMDDLVSVTVISTDPSLSESFDAVYKSYFHGHYPARGFVGANALSGGAHFEILAVAVKPPRLQL